MDAEAKVARLLDTLRGATDNHEINALLTELGNLISDDRAAYRALANHYDDLVAQVGNAKISVASIMARLGVSALTLATPSMVPNAGRPDFARGGPAGEIPLAALHLLRYAGDVVPLDDDAIGSAIEEPDADPRFDSYPHVFAAAVAHLGTAAYYLLDPQQSFAALASEPLTEETFPPLPFPRVWLEMTHLTPYMRFTHDEERALKHSVLDVLGIGIAEIEQGRIWDVFVPFQYDGDDEFFFIAERIAPDHVIAADPLLQNIGAAFAQVRQLAIGGIHLATARNVPVEEIALPRAQRRRIARQERREPPRLYFVDIAAAGEHGASAAGGRVYRVRWLVRGHWRHSRHGISFCTCCDPPQIASWVKPYVKGPVGAPWKGRQVRRQVAPSQGASGTALTDVAPDLARPTAEPNRNGERVGRCRITKKAETGDTAAGGPAEWTGDELPAATAYDRRSDERERAEGVAATHGSEREDESWASEVQPQDAARSSCVPRGVAEPSCRAGSQLPRVATSAKAATGRERPA